MVRVARRICIDTTIALCTMFDPHLYINSIPSALLSLFIVTVFVLQVWSLATLAVYFRHRQSDPCLHIPLPFFLCMGAGIATIPRLICGSCSLSRLTDMPIQVVSVVRGFFWFPIIVSLVSQRLSFFLIREPVCPWQVQCPPFTDL